MGVCSMNNQDYIDFLESEDYLGWLFEEDD